jgi:hypothetical protein
MFSSHIVYPEIWWHIRKKIRRNLGRCYTTTLRNDISAANVRLPRLYENDALECGEMDIKRT